MDDLIKLLRYSGFGVYITNIFAGCIFYADDILLVCGLQQLVALYVKLMVASETSDLIHLSARVSSLVADRPKL